MALAGVIIKLYLCTRKLVLRWLTMLTIHWKIATWPSIGKKKVLLFKCVCVHELVQHLKRTKITFSIIKN